MKLIHIGSATAGVLALLLTACAGGDSSSRNATTPPPPSINSVPSNIIDKQQAISIAKHHIKTYLANDTQTENRVIKVSENIIDLHNINDNIIAYMVPLYEAEKENIGYITIGAISDGCDAYEISINSSKMNNIESILKTSSSSKVVFIPPMTYILKSDTMENDRHRYYNVDSPSTSLEDITTRVENNLDNIKGYYKNIKIIEDIVTCESVINHVRNEDNSTQNVVFPNPWGNEDVRLVNQEQDKFVPIDVPTSASSKYYGCDQRWWEAYGTLEGDLRSEYGCGPAAAANITAYFARKDTSKYGKLYGYPKYKKALFLSHMDDVWNYVTPGSAGLWSVTDFANGVVKFGKSRGVTLTPIWSSASFTLDGTANYIKNGLNSDSPVALVNWQLVGYSYGRHWITVTKYFKEKSTGKRWIAISNGGTKESIDYVQWFNSANYWGGGLIYFK